MANPAALTRRIKALNARGPLDAREAGVLFDMLHAGREETPASVDFIARYLPAKRKVPTGLPRAGLVAGEPELAATRRRIAADPLSGDLWRKLRAKCTSCLRRGDALHIDWDRRKNLTLWDRRQGHWRLTVAMQDLAWAGAIGREPRLSRAAADILLSFARRRQGWGPMHCNYGRPYKGWLFDNLLDLGHITLGSAIAYDRVRPALSREERAEVAAYFEPFFHKALTHRHESLHAPGNNFAPIGFSGAGLMALALADDFPKLRRGVLAEVLAWAQAYAVFSLDHIAGQDGGPIEGSGYGSASLYYIVLFALALRRAGGADLFHHPTFRRLARYMAIESLPGGGAINNFNDNHYQTHVCFWPLVARHNNDPLGDWVWFNHAGPGAMHADPREAASLCELPYLLLFREPGHDALTPRELDLPRIHHFRGLDHLTARTGWDNADLHLTFQCTKPPRHAHTQQDRLNYTLYALGERFVVDSGYGMVPIPGSSEVKRMGGAGESHNQVLIDGAGQAHRKGVEAGAILRWERKGDWAWAVGDATGSYEKATLARRLLAVRLTAKEPVVVQVDWIVPRDAGPHRFDCLLQTGRGNQVRPGAGGRATIIGARQQRALNLCYAASGPSRLTVDEWIDHPRLHFASRSGEHVGLLLLAGGRVERKPGRGKAPGHNQEMSWFDDGGAGTVRIEHSPARGKRLGTLEVIIEPAGLSVRL